ncbi:MAG: hypothetical protein V7640_801 [Betaproteobacteria bacterium]
MSPVEQWSSEPRAPPSLLTFHSHVDLFTNPLALNWQFITLVIPLAKTEPNAIGIMEG